MSAKYYLDLFSPETYEAFSRSSREVTGFRVRHRKAADRVQIGDKLICYMTKLSRWFGILEVTSRAYVERTPIFLPADDPFVIRFKVRPLVWLDKEHAIPIREDDIWEMLSFTKGHNKNSSAWTGPLRGSLNQIDVADGQFLERAIFGQAQTKKIHEINEREYSRLATHTVRRIDKTITVSVPQDTDADFPAAILSPPEVRESIKVQALLAEIGTKMGLRIWIPRGDRGGVVAEWKGGNGSLLDVLPLNYDETTLKTIEQIDVLWLRGRAIVRAFEVEHTTSIYSGILRMADLLALQPNMDIKLHIVAPHERRDKVFQEIRRPVFSLLEKGPLSESCTFLSYDSLRELARQRHLAYLSDNVLDEYAEEAE
jgi:hypothetical protein